MAWTDGCEQGWRKTVVKEQGGRADIWSKGRSADGVRTSGCALTVVAGLKVVIFGVKKM